MRRAAWMVAGALGLYETVLVGWLWLGDPPDFIGVFFYNLSWWPYLLLVQTVAYLWRGRSLLYDNPDGFLWMCLASAPFWTAYEILNVAMLNWDYIHLPVSPALRWGGYFVAYASVLPAIRIYLDLQGTNSLENFAEGGLDSRLRGNDGSPSSPISHIPLPASLEKGFSLALGAGQLALILLFPKIFYPLAWSFSFFLTEPFVANIRPELSYVNQWRAGRWRWTFKTMAAGMLAGFTWEFLNWKSTAKWRYTVDHDVVLFKIFEMPVIGYLGFATFALCAESFSNLLLAHVSNRNRVEWKIALALGLGICIAGFYLIDTHIWKR